MATGIVYLDVDDEITSAAARIRQVPGRRAAVVLPYGSRVATSRINFRLLSRDALINEKQLAVVAGDSATRSLAASAGLPVFASVAEYEASLAGLPAEPVPEPEAPPPSPKRRSRKGAAATAAPTASPATPATPTPQVEPAAEPPAPTATPAPDAGSATDATQQVAIPWEAPATVEAPRTTAWQPPTPSERPVRPSERTVQRPAPDARSRLPIAIVLAAIALVVLVGGVGAYVWLPSATIVVTPRAEALPPLDITVTADPSVTEPDAATRVVPATVVELDVAVEDTFPVTGKRIEEERATGTVRFANLDFLRSNSIPAGSIVSTNAGVRFETVKAVTVPRADLVGLTVFPGRVNVGVTAVEPGLSGNVEPNTIVVVPRGEDPQALKVVNPDATSGGTHEEFPQVVQADLDAAVEQLTAQLDGAFQERLADPSIAVPGATVFPETAQLGEPVPSVDPATLLEQEVETFELGLAASGTVLTVDPAPVAEIAEGLIRGSVEPGHQLVADSVRVDVGAGVVSGGTVTFSATAEASQVAILDPDTLRTQVLGQPLDAAREILAPYGDVELTAWPDWVGSVPTIADRVTVEIDQAVPVEPTPSEGTS